MHLPSILKESEVQRCGEKTKSAPRKGMVEEYTRATHRGGEVARALLTGSIVLVGIYNILNQFITLQSIRPSSVRKGHSWMKMNNHWRRKKKIIWKKTLKTKLKRTFCLQKSRV